MTSQVGWARSNILYDTLKETPKPGSPLEFVMLHVFSLRQSAEYLKYKLVAQSSLSAGTSEASKESLKDLFATMFPHKKSEQEHHTAKALQILERQLKAGPIRATPILEGK
ncbi:MAG: hypothetical protein FJ096_22405, partial [Deltaproteobacteria bacterium]|nr:hypothetical protein [Deltaproteobacteria bacterium]